MDRVTAIFRSKGLKATAQRVIVYQVMTKLCHASVDEVVRHVHEVMPTIAVASVYNILESLCENRLIGRLFTDDNKLYYDITPAAHHHIYGRESNKIEDFKDDQLTELLNNYFANTQISNFNIEDVRVQIIGTFK